ncbi:Zinc-binding dehydrogenase [Carpediemonas membranifera]|uniref:Zinc-binding dehydrogenase n=1 Tax=Carpediemonas membranifera TaxID=201153 RepID=A0A8J6AXZ9_9EUKA|nr:Zinc-binding dehydrogenase [Carpediemonas membranifera]|eukprot:KAG9397621.1 Zinc-binding dehydrogenase [Carpediemonas membranifera]
MRALLLQRTGKPYDFEMGTFPVPEPGPNDVRIKIAATACNPIDYKLATHGNASWTVFPRILGLDTAGVVDKVGLNVADYHVGDRVVQHGDLRRRGGGYAEYTVCDTRHLARIPRTVSYIDAAAAMCAGLTAMQAVSRKLHVKAGDTVLIHGGAGGVGSYAVQLCKVLGATVMTTCQGEKADYVRSLGADEAIDYTTEDVSQRVMELTNGLGADCILNTLSPETGVEDVERLAFNGVLCMISGPMPVSMADLGMFVKGQTLTTCFLGGAHMYQHEESLVDLKKMAEEILDLQAEGSIRSPIQKIIRLNQVPRALDELEDRHVTGKIIVDMQ